MIRTIVLNERELRAAKADIARAKAYLSASALISSTKSDLSPNVVESHRKSVSSLIEVLEASIKNYDLAKDGEYSNLAASTQGDPGMMLIVARISCGLSQGDLACSLGMKEQQIQRYEADRYRSISLSNYRKIAQFIGVDLTASMRSSEARKLGKALNLKLKFDEKEVSSVLSYAFQKKWFNFIEGGERSKDAIFDYLQEFMRTNSNPALLRSGLGSGGVVKDFSLVAWKARVFERASKELPFVEEDFDFTDITWIEDLVRLSGDSQGPLKASALLRSKGLIFLVEPHLPGLCLDGAAMIFEERPLIALTLRHDRLDNFWFTLLHELAHVFLHHFSGLRGGFFDDLDASEDDEFEKEANEFAGSALIPDAQWRVSPARISKDERIIQSFAEKLKIHPAIIFGRIRMERKKYNMYGDKVGSGEVRKLFF